MVAPIQLTALLVFLAVFLAVVAIYLLLRRQPSQIETRLDSISRQAVSGRGDTASILQRDAPQSGLGRLLGWFISGLVPEALGGQDLRLRLQRAGRYGPSAVPAYIAARALLPILFAGACVAFCLFRDMETSRIVLYAFVLGLAGFVVPDIVLYAMTERRREDIVIGLPDALDLMVVCVEAGLGLNEALLRVGQESHRTCPPLARELRLVNREMLAGVPRMTALQNLAHRTGVADLKALVALLIQTEKLGTSIAKSLRVHADNLRIRRRHRAEEKARKVSVKLVFPLILFIFPTLMLIMLGPGIIRLLQALQSANR